MWLDGAPGDEGIDFSVFLHCLRRKWLPGLLIGSVLAAIVSGLLFFLIPVSFQAISLLRVKRVEPNVMRKVMSSTWSIWLISKRKRHWLPARSYSMRPYVKPGIMQLSMMRREDGRDWIG